MNPIHFLVNTVEEFIGKGQKFLFPKIEESPTQITIPSGETKSVVDVTSTEEKLDSLIDKAQYQIEQDLHVEGTLSGEVQQDEKIELDAPEIKEDVSSDIAENPKIVELDVLDESQEIQNLIELQPSFIIQESIMTSPKREVGPDEKVFPRPEITKPYETAVTKDSRRDPFTEKAVKAVKRHEKNIKSHKKHKKTSSEKRADRKRNHKLKKIEHKYNKKHKK